MSLSRLKIDLELYFQSVCYAKLTNFSLHLFAVKTHLPGCVQWYDLSKNNGLSRLPEKGSLFHCKSSSMTLDPCYSVNECGIVLLVNPSSGEFYRFHFEKIDDISSRLDCSYQPEMFWCFSPTHTSVEGKANEKGGGGSSGSCAGSGPVQLHCNFHVGCKCFTRTNYGRTWHSANEQAAYQLMSFFFF